MTSSAKVKTGTQVYALGEDSLFHKGVVKAHQPDPEAGDTFTVELEDGTVRELGREQLTFEEDPADTRDGALAIGTWASALWTDDSYYAAELVGRFGTVWHVRFEDGSEAWTKYVEPDEEAGEEEEEASTPEGRDLSEIADELDAIKKLEPNLDRLSALLEEVSGRESEEILPALLGVLERCGNEESYGVFETLRHRVEAVLVKDPDAGDELAKSFVRAPSFTAAVILQKLARSGSSTAENALAKVTQKKKLPKDLADLLRERH